jgi:hypothetical protein
MRGQFVLTSHRRVTFCGVPLFHTKEEYDQSNLTMADFAPHDPSIVAFLSLWSTTDDSSLKKVQRYESRGTTGMLQNLFGGNKERKQKTKLRDLSQTPEPLPMKRESPFVKKNSELLKNESLTSKPLIPKDRLKTSSVNFCPRQSPSGSDGNPRLFIYYFLSVFLLIIFFFSFHFF